MSRFAVWTLALGILGSGALRADTEIPRATALLHSRPIAFEPNAGRFSREVKFAARTGDYRILLSDRGAVFEDGRRRFSVAPLHASRQIEVSAEGPLPFETSYFLGNRSQQWQRGVANYSRVRYKGVYPGIDQVYYGAEGELEYDFIIQPGADPSRIALQFQGVRRLGVTEAGDLQIETAAGLLTHRRPVVYQEQGQRVEGRFRLISKNVVGFAVDSYDHTLPLTIDPVLSYSSLLGGSGGDAVVAAKVDRAGFVWLAGYVNTSDFTATGDAYKSANAGGTDIFLAKVDPNASGAASLVYFTYIGGTGQDLPTAMALDASGNVYLTGSTTSIDFPLAGTQPQKSLATNADATLNQDAFVLKLLPRAGGGDALLYGTYLGGTSLDSGAGIDVDGSGAIYVIGSTRSGDFPTTSNAYQTQQWGPGDTFIAKILPDSASSLVYSSYLGGEALDQGRAIVVTPAGAVYAAAETFSSTFPFAGNPYRISGAGGGDIVVFQMDLTKSGINSLTYTTYLGGTGLDDVTRIALDAAGRVLVTGFTLSGNFDITPDAVQTRLAGTSNAFVTRLDLTAPRGQVLSYSSYLGSSGGDVAYDIASDGAGGAWLTGYTVSTDFPVTPDALQATSGGGIDVFVTRLKFADSGDSSILYSTYLGQTGVNVGYALAVTADGRVAVAGQSSPKVIRVTGDSFQPSFAGGVSDGFVLVLSPSAPQ